MPPKALAVIDDLLDYDLAAVTTKLGLSPSIAPLKSSVAVNALNYAERLSRRTDVHDRSLCLLICALVWEHRREEWTALPAFLTELLVRIGLGPTAMMLTSTSQDDLPFPAIGSLRAELEIAVRLLVNEVTPSRGDPIDLTDFQAKVWRSLDTARRLGISAPTSAGKSFVLAHRIGELLAHETGDILYVVPTLSLITQVTRDIRRVLREMDVHGCLVSQTYSPKHRQLEKSIVYVLTQERAHAALLQSPDTFKDLLLFVVDEVQNVERASDESDDRSRTLYDVINSIVRERTPIRVILSGPRIDDIEDFSRDLLGETAIGISDELPPVVNVTYSFGSTDGKTTISQHVDTGRPTRRLPLNGKTLPLKKVFGRRRWGDDIYGFLGDALPSLRTDGGVLIFSPTAVQATKTALEVSRRMEKRDTPSEHLDSLSEYARDTVHPRYGLRESLPEGIAYHHGRMPHHLRMAVEHAFAKEIVDTVACTTTLMQGVNLPAKTLIVRNPNLFIRASSNHEPPILSGYEFGNLRGRAGRLMKDFVGRTIILDESKFKQQELPLFEFPGKTLKHGYEYRFQQYRDVLLEDLEQSSPPHQGNSYNDLLMYVRQTVLRHGDGARIRLERTGVKLNDEQLTGVRRQLDRLLAPRDFILTFPYWDPFDLDRLWQAIQSSDIPVVPSSPFSSTLSESLRGAVQTIGSIIPFYKTKYLGALTDPILWSIVTSATEWSRGVLLKHMLDWGHTHAIEDPFEIERRVHRIQNDASFSLPRLLAPLVVAQNPDNPILTFMEMGAYDPIARRLIELGLPRETALRVARTAGSDKIVDSNGKVLDHRFPALLTSLWPHLSFWERLQLSEIFPSVAP